jgi:Outer membrane protein beta-barrel domain
MADVSKFGPFMTVALGVLALLTPPMAHEADAQGRPAPAAEVAAGWVGFADDGIVSETLIGGAARVYLLPRVGIGPEVLYLRGARHSHLVVTANVTWDVFAPVNGRPPAVTPFVVVGGGLFQTRETFPSGDFTSSEGAFTAGGGVRALVGDRMTIGIDARVGWELHLRVNGTIGVRLGQ